MPARFWTHERVDELEKMVHAGLSNKEIAAHFGKTTSAIKVVRKFSGIRLDGGSRVEAGEGE